MATPRASAFADVTRHLCCDRFYGPYNALQGVCPRGITRPGCASRCKSVLYVVTERCFMKLASSKRRRRNRTLVTALYLNAGLLAAVLVAVLSRGGGGASPAMAAQSGMPQIGGG